MTAAAAAPAPGPAVCITGLGAITPLGPDVAAFTAGLLEARSGVHLLEGP